MMNFEVNARWKCNTCGTLVETKNKSKPKKCSCGGASFSEYNYYEDSSKEDIFAYLDVINEEEEKEDILQKTFLAEDIEEEEKIKKLLLRCYEDICYLIEKYLDMDVNKIKIIALWIIGTYFHDDFNTYPYLYINAMRGSGKTRLLNLISAMAENGSVQNNITESVLFRTKGTMCIDEAEGFGRKGKETLVELLNSAYKKGTKVRRMKKKKTNDSEEFVVEEYELYRPLSIANITGIDNVLGDRCVKIIIEKSMNEKKTRLLENIEFESKINRIKHILYGISSHRCSLCSVVAQKKLYTWWNNSIYNIYYTLPKTTHTTLTTLKKIPKYFKEMKETSLNGRDLELSFPLLIVSMWIDGAYEKEGIFSEILNILDQISQEKKKEEMIENVDISLLDYLSQEPETEYFISVRKITEGFRSFLQSHEDWINNKWIGRAINRLGIVIERRRLNQGIEVRLDFAKIKDKIRGFK